MRRVRVFIWVGAVSLDGHEIVDEGDPLRVEEPGAITRPDRAKLLLHRRREADAIHDHIIAYASRRRNPATRHA